MTPSRLVARILEDEDEFDLVGEIMRIPEKPTRGIVRYDMVLDDDGEPVDSYKHSLVEIDSADEAAEYLESAGAVHASTSFFHSGMWYLSDHETTRDGYEESTWHLKGFTAEEEAEVYKQFTRRR